MKKILVALGKSVLYLAVFLSQQLSLSSVFSVVLPLIHYGKTQDELNAIFNQYVALITLLSGAMTLFILWLFFKLMNRSPLKQCGMVKTDFKALVLSLGAGIGSCVAVMLLLSVIPFPEAWMATYAEDAAMIQEGQGVVLFLASVVMAPLVEEVVFRGLIYRSLRAAMHPVVAALLTSLVFGAVHGNLVWFFYTFLFSLLLIFLLESSDSLWAPVLAHAAFNTVGQLPIITEETHLATAVIVFAVGMAVFAVSFILLIDYRADRRAALAARSATAVSDVSADNFSA